jgi:hypothetical protein
MFTVGKKATIAGYEHRFMLETSCVVFVNLLLFYLNLTEKFFKKANHAPSIT